MKKQKLSKKLLLNKETVSHLTNDEMSPVKGGTVLTFEKGLCWTDYSCFRVRKTWDDHDSICVNCLPNGSIDYC